MTFDHHYQTIEEAEHFVNGTIEDLLPGYIKRNRTDLLVAAAAVYLEAHPQGSGYEDFIGGAETALDILAGNILGKTSK